MYCNRFQNTCLKRSTYIAIFFMANRAVPDEKAHRSPLIRVYSVRYIVFHKYSTPFNLMHEKKHILLQRLFLFTE